MSLDCNKPKPCKKEEKPKEIFPPPTPTFSVCVGVDFVLHWDGTRATLERTRNTANGTYGRVTVTDGCITALGECEVPQYVPPFCAPNPSSCQDSTVVGTAEVAIDPRAGNTLVETPAGLFAKTYLVGGNNIQLDGAGTQQNPYRISAVSGSGKTVVVGSNNITVRTDADTGVATIGLSPTGIGKGSHNGISFNEFGLITGISETESAGVKVGAGLESHTEGDDLVIKHPTITGELSGMFGAYAVSFNNTGHLGAIERSINIPAGTYQLGAYNVTLNAYGSVTNIAQNSAVLAGELVTKTQDGILTFDTSGRLIKHEDTPATDLPIRDMYHIKVEGGVVTKLDFGNPLLIQNQTSTTFALPLPDYVTETDQVQVNGAVSYTVDAVTSSVVITYASEANIAIVYRG